METAELKYNKLAEKVREMLAVQKAYFKSNKDFQILKRSKALEAELDEMVNPKPKVQQSFFSDEYLGR